MPLFLLLMFPSIALIVVTIIVVMRYRERHLSFFGQFLLSFPAFFILALFIYGIATDLNDIYWPISMMICSLPAWLVFMILVLYYQSKLGEKEEDGKVDL